MLTEMSAAPQDDLFRAVALRPELERADDESGGLPTMRGYFAVFNQWTEIDSLFEGHFMERIDQGAFNKTISENRDAVKVLYDHGHDFQVGNKVLGPIEDLREKQRGVYYEVPLLDTSYNRDLLPGLEAGLYGASFRFSVVKDEWVAEGEPSKSNPKGLPERTIKEVRLFEFGPVTFPAYQGATAGVRSITDQYRGTDRTPGPEAAEGTSGESRTEETVEPPQALPEPEQRPVLTPSAMDAYVKRHAERVKRAVASTLHKGDL